MQAARAPAAGTGRDGRGESEGATRGAPAADARPGLAHAPPTPRAPAPRPALPGARSRRTGQGAVTSA